MLDEAKLLPVLGVNATIKAEVADIFLKSCKRVNSIKMFLIFTSSFVDNHRAAAGKVMVMMNVGGGSVSCKDNV